MRWEGDVGSVYCLLEGTGGSTRRQCRLARLPGPPDDRPVDCPLWQATPRGHGTVCGGRPKRAKLHGSVLHAMSYSQVILAEDRTIGCWKRGRCRADLNHVSIFDINTRAAPGLTRELAQAGERCACSCNARWKVFATGTAHGRKRQWRGRPPGRTLPVREPTYALGAWLLVLDSESVRPNYAMVVGLRAGLGGYGKDHS